jgi:hypothetical protein
MHRSGTSAVTRVLSLLGADLPGDLMPPLAGNNARGFWESRGLESIHNELLAAAGSSWDDWTRLAPEWFDSPVSARFRARLLAWLDTNFASSRVFVIKDPRMCRFFPLWRSVLEEFGSDVRVVLPLRNPVEVASSLSDRDGFSAATSHLMWLRHVLDAEHDTRDLRRCIVPFAALLHDQDRILRTIRHQLRIKWGRPIAAARVEIDDFLSVAERHHAIEDRCLELRPDLTAWVRCTYETLVKMARDGESPEAQAELEAIATEIDRASATFGPLVAEQKTIARIRAQEGDTLRTTISTQAAETARLSQELMTVRAALDERVSEAERLRGELSVVNAVLGERSAALHRALEERSAEVAGVREEMVGIRALLEGTRREVNLSQAVLAERKVEVERLVGELAHLRGELTYMIHSVSWKLTSPLRAIRKRIRLVRRAGPSG